MQRRSRILGAPVALAAVGALLAGCSDDEAAARTAGPTRSSTGISTTTASDPARLRHAVRALPRTAGGQQPLAAGRYRFPLEGVAADIDLPEGSVAHADDGWIEIPGGVLKVERANADYGVQADPCRRPHDVDPVGPTVADLVAAIEGSPALRTGSVRAVQIGGAPGRLLRVSIPASYDVTSCVDEQVGLPGAPGSINNMPPGYTADWWILDVDGARIVVHHLCDPCGRAASDTAADVVRTIAFTPVR